MNVLITGMTGFVGSHLAEYILRESLETNVYGFARWRSPRNNIKNCEDDVTIIEGDLIDLPSVVEMINTVLPDYIFHLAAQSYVQYSFLAPVATLESNCIGTVNLLEAIKQAKQSSGYDPIVHICSSSEVYGQVNKKDIPITEECPLRPASPYAVSKVCEDMLGLQYYLSWGIKTIRSRMFTHSGPRRGDVFAISTFAKQIAKIESKGDSGVVKVGNLDSIRTFADVRDAVRAYWLMVHHCTPGEVYNIGGNETMSVGEMLEKLIQLSPAHIETEVDPSRLRPSDVTEQIPCCDKFKKITGWEPKIPFNQTLYDTLNYWRSIYKVQETRS